MDKKTYKKYLKSKEWVDTRRERKRIDNNRCHLCGGMKYLNVHHVTYSNVGNEDVKNDLVTLCRKCHYMVHHIKDASQKEYNIYKSVCEKKGKDSEDAQWAMYYLENKVKEKIIEEFWQRDKDFGGDLRVFTNSQAVVKRLLKVTKIIYPDIGDIRVAKAIRAELKKVSF